LAVLSFAVNGVFFLNNTVNKINIKCRRKVAH